MLHRTDGLAMECFFIALQVLMVSFLERDSSYSTIYGAHPYQDSATRETFSSLVNISP